MTLYIVQHLPNSSNVQPTKEQKLELYAYYKQVSGGDIDTQRPGIFDVVGRAKWDAWKKLEGTSELEAKYRYVEILLKVATEAYKKPAGRAQANQIIQSFAVMQPSGDSGDSSSEEEEDDDDSSLTSEDAEEIAYLRQVEKSIPVNNNRIGQHERRPSIQQQQQQQHQRRGQPWRNNERSSSRASSQYSGHLSMMTAPTELRRGSQSSSTAATSTARLVSRNNSRELYDENFDDSVNPWVLHPSNRQYRIDSRPPTQQDVYRSPMSTSSSVTATQYNNHSLGGRSEVQQQVMLGPATKRALESIQREIEALNERINGLRDEIVNRGTRNRKEPVRSLRKPILPDDGWKWVIKAAVKHALMNLVTATVLFIILYKNDSPISQVIIRIIQKYLQKLKLK
ncbi:unnamed protein product [Mucor hiemalis]